MPMTDTDLPANVASALDAAGAACDAAGVFERVERDGAMLRCHAKDTPEPVVYRLEAQPDGLWVSWNSADRYISQSIEADLMWTGDDLDDMIDEELVDLGWTRGRLKPLDHFRNDEMLFTFRSKLPLDPAQLSEADGEDLARCVLAYELAFRELGDMAGDEDED
jgi:hypothetical protein